MSDMKVDNFQLINEVSKRRSLWDTNIKLINRKDICAVLWKEVSDIMQLDVTLCKKRFKSLRDCYRSEIRKIQQHRMLNSNWPYFKALEFLRDIFDPQDLVPFPPQAFDMDSIDPNKLDDFIIDLDNEDSYDFDVMGDIFQHVLPEPKPFEDMTSNLSAVRPGLLSPVRQESPQAAVAPSTMSLPKAPATKRARRRKTSSSNDESFNGVSQRNGHATKMATTPKEVASSTPKDDADYNFLVSILPHMKSLSDMSNLKFRMEISRILVDLKQNDITTTQRETECITTPTMPKLTPAPTTNYSRRSEPTRYAMSAMSNGGGCYMDHEPVMVECDVKIENEPIYRD